MTASLSSWALDPRTMSYDDMAAYTVVLFVVVLTVTVRVLLRSVRGGS